MSTDWATLSGFQRDLLREVAANDSPKGLMLKEALRANYEGLAHARVYQNLNSLLEADLITKHAVDGRTNAYELTTEGRATLEQAKSRLAAALREREDG